MALVEIDGSRGEGGGQMLRTSLSLAALTGRGFRVINIRGNRPKPGLRPQHLTAVRSIAAICGAQLQGDEVNSSVLTFLPKHAVQGGTYHFDVADAAPNGSAGAMTLVWQALVWPLAFAKETTALTLVGGTHVPFSPPFDYIQNVSLPAFQCFGVDGTLALDKYGWMPNGEGMFTATIRPINSLNPTTFETTATQDVWGSAPASNLPSHIPQRMVNRATNLLKALQCGTIDIRPIRTTGPSTGTGLFLWTQNAGFGTLGRKRLPANKVADETVAQYRAFVENGAAVDEHLADQLLIPMALASGKSTFTTDVLSQHTITNAGLLRQWLGVTIKIEGKLGHKANIVVDGIGLTVNKQL